MSLCGLRPIRAILSGTWPGSAVALPVLLLNHMPYTNLSSKVRIYETIAVDSMPVVSKERIP